MVIHFFANCQKCKAFGRCTDSSMDTVIGKNALQNFNLLAKKRRGKRER